MILTRRKLMIGAVGILAAPAIVRYASLMPVRVKPEWGLGPAMTLLLENGVEHNGGWLEPVRGDEDIR